mmetsp:Transcript_27187/g.36331  ORF Transcript_27187/g.36331 Transcript_27187/m.36331 type:complete len:132 (+) Transcript_27187:152-547(+)
MRHEMTTVMSIPRQPSVLEEGGLIGYAHQSSIHSSEQYWGNEVINLRVRAGSNTKQKRASPHARRGSAVNFNSYKVHVPGVGSGSQVGLVASTRLGSHTAASDNQTETVGYSGRAMNTVSYRAFNESPSQQ